MNQIRHFELELAELKRSLVTMGNLVEQALEIAVRAIVRPNAEAREQARAIEQQLDQMDNQIEERCHQILALQHPVARDLRLLISSMRITSDLEQVGDLAESIAKRARWIANHHAVTNPPQLEVLGRHVIAMINQAMDAFVTGNLLLARNVLRDEREADRMTKQCFLAIQEGIAAQPTLVGEYTHMLRAVGHLEHVGDIAVSIADEAVYIHSGATIRHQHGEVLGT